jgi:hypothetical protein
MSDKELIAFLRDLPFLRAAAAADRIEQLVAINEALTVEREWFEGEWVSAVDKLNKAVEALASLEKQASTTSSRGAVTGPHWTHLTIAILKARATLAEIEGLGVKQTG